MLIVTMIGDSDAENLTTKIALFTAWSWFQSGINTDGAHNPPMTKKIAKGDIISMNCFPMVSG